MVWAAAMAEQWTFCSTSRFCLFHFCCWKSSKKHFPFHKRNTGMPGKWARGMRETLEEPERTLFGKVTEAHQKCRSFYENNVHKSSLYFPSRIMIYLQSLVFILISSPSLPGLSYQVDFRQYYDSSGWHAKNLFKTLDHALSCFDGSIARLKS